nr:Zinc finger, CCHC-type [Ipomoea batatas]
MLLLSKSQILMLDSVAAQSHQIPEQDHSILSSASTKRAIRRHRNSVHIASVPSKSRPKLAVGQIPDFHGAVPRRRDDGGLQSIRAETHARYPFGVPVLVLNRVLALTQGVPQLDGAVTGSGDDLAVIDGEGDGEDVLGVADEAAGGGAGLKVPEAELGVPGAGEGELAVRGEDDVLDKMGMAGEAAAWNAKLRAILCERPNNDGFVAGGGDDKVGVVDWSGDCRHPIGVSLHCSAED